MTPRSLGKLIAPLRRSISLMVGRAVVNLVNDALGVQGVQISLLADEVRDNVERFQQYGYTSHPKKGAQAIVVSVGGNRNHVVVIACDDRRYRLTGLEEGEVALYDDLGTKIVLKRGNEIEVTAATKVSIVSPLVEMSGDLVVAGNAEVTGNVTAGGNVEAVGDIRDAMLVNPRTVGGMREQYNTHVHGGVTAGGASTAQPNQVM